MLMNELIQHIRHLLFTSGSVAVEGVGMFMQVPRSASFSGIPLLKVRMPQPFSRHMMLSVRTTLNSRMRAATDMMPGRRVRP